MAKITVEYLLELLVKKESNDINYEQLVELLNEKASEPEWINVEDRLPEAGVEVLAFGLDTSIEVYYLDTDKNWHYIDEYFRIGDANPTHWMPLPNKPVNSQPK